jgi:hypothetical protein
MYSVMTHHDASTAIRDKVVQRILRHAKPTVTRERYIKVFDPAVLEAMQRMELTVQALRPNWSGTGQQQN